MHILILLVFLSTNHAQRFKNKLDSNLQNSIEVNGKANIIVCFESTDEVISVLTNEAQKTWNGGSSRVYNALKYHSEQSQSKVRSLLKLDKYTSLKTKWLWISNQMYIEAANASLISLLAELEDVKEIQEEIVIQLDDPILHPLTEAEDMFKFKNGVWGIEKIKAKEAWSVGGQGEGVVVGIIDTGARVTHEAIRDSFRGGSHSWYDPYSQTQQPIDDNGHGTHVTGTITGRFEIGVAPGSKWISCKGLGKDGGGTFSALLDCAQFMLCPHESDGENPKCDMAPHIVSNSWGAAAHTTAFDAVIRAWHAANIIPIFAAGNNGPRCSTIMSPADSTSQVISVAATDIDDAIALFSSRGPARGTNEHKPDISAPGVAILSAGIGTDFAYVLASGTSMACPHVAGVVALLKSNCPTATFDTVRTTLASTALRNVTYGGIACSNLERLPNFEFGYGIVNAVEALKGCHTV